MKIAAYYNPAGFVQYLDPESLCNVFNDYTDSLSGFIDFCNNESTYRSPNSDDLLRFDYDPTTGEEIDWMKILEENKKLIRDDKL